MAVHTNNPVAATSRARQAGGFTLIELMIVVAILAVLATIAFTSYREQVVKSRRAAATTCLQERAQFMERYYTTHLSYTGAPAPPAQCGPDLNPFYTISFSTAPAGKNYVLAAAPTSLQSDSKCGTLSLSAQGVRGKSGTGSLAECW